MTDAFNKSGFGGRIKNWLFGGYINYPVDDGAYFAWQLSLSYSVIKRLRLGLMINPIPYVSVRGSGGQEERVEGKAYSFIADYIVSPVGIKKYGFEFSLGSGIGYYPIKINGILGKYSDDERSFEIKGNKFGLLLNARLEYYTSEVFSFRFSLTKTFIPSIEIPQVSAHNIIWPWDNQLNEELETLYKHSINVSYFSIDFGLWRT